MHQHPSITRGKQTRNVHPISTCVMQMIILYCILGLKLLKNHPYKLFLQLGMISLLTSNTKKIEPRLNGLLKPIYLRSLSSIHSLSYIKKYWLHALSLSLLPLAGPVLVCPPPFARMGSAPVPPSPAAATALSDSILFH